MKSISDRDFDLDIDRAKRATKNGPVFITKQGGPAFVLLSIQEYRDLTGGREPVSEVFSRLPKTDVCDIEFANFGNGKPRSAELGDD